MRQNRFVYLLQLALLFSFSGSAQPQPESTPDSYELTCYAGYDGRLLVNDLTNSDFEGLKIHAFVKADVPFSFFTEDGHGNHLMISGTVREMDAQDFCLTNGQLQGFGMSTEGLVCSSKETRRIRKILEPILGPDSRYSPNDPPEAESSIWWISIGPGYRLSLKRQYGDFSASALTASALTITSDAANVILTWPTNVTGFVLESSTNPVLPVWTTSSQTPAIINGRNTVTNAIAATQHFFRLSH